MGLNDYKAGMTAGKLMGLYLEGRGNVAVIGVHRDLASMEDRIRGFRDKIKIEYPGINILDVYSLKEDTRSGMDIYNESLKTLTEEIIEKRLDINGIYVTSSLTGHVGKVLETMEIGYKIILIGHENTKETRKMLLNDMVHATVFQDQKEEIKRAVNILWKHITGDEEHDFPDFYSKQRILIKEQIE